MAKAVDRFQRLTMRNNFLFKCALPEFAGFEVCSEKLIQVCQKTMQTNLDMAANYHQVLFLGAKKLETFQDPRLQVRASVAFWQIKLSHMKYCNWWGV
jgi:hypothetical protein